MKLLLVVLVMLLPGCKNWQVSLGCELETGTMSRLNCGNTVKTTMHPEAAASEKK